MVMFSLFSKSKCLLSFFKFFFLNILLECTPCRCNKFNGTFDSLKLTELLTLHVFTEDIGEQGYVDELNKISEKWIMVELKHRVSKAASEEFWDVAAEKFHDLQRAKIKDEVPRPIPKFVSLRNKLYKQKVPNIIVEEVYQHRESEEIISVGSNTKGPSPPKYSSNEYLKLYEVATVKV